MNGSWALGSMVGLGITVIILLICLMGFIGGFYDRKTGQGLMWGSLLVGLVMIALAASPLMFYPYKKEYHYWEPISGTVSDVEKRLVGSGSGMEEKYIVAYEGSNQEYRIDDTRASFIERGDEVTVLCKRVWQFAATDGFVCRWGERIPA